MAVAEQAVADVSEARMFAQLLVFLHRGLDVNARPDPAKAALPAEVCPRSVADGGILGGRDAGFNSGGAGWVDGTELYLVGLQGVAPCLRVSFTEAG